MGFVEYFDGHAAVADELARPHITSAYVVATATLDALAAIWFAKFPDNAAQLARDVGRDYPPASLRLARFVTTFAPADVEARRIGIICFAEDMLAQCPHLAAEAEQLLRPRRPRGLAECPGQTPGFGDKPIAELIAESPNLPWDDGLRIVAEHYQYPALVYRWFRCPIVHSLGLPDRVHLAVFGESAAYFGPMQEVQNLDDNGDVTVEPLPGPHWIRIGFGVPLLTRWIRTTVRAYVARCETVGTGPAENYDPGAVDRVEAIWARVRRR